METPCNACCVNSSPCWVEAHKIEGGHPGLTILAVNWNIKQQQNQPLALSISSKVQGLRENFLSCDIVSRSVDKTLELKSKIK